MNPNVNSIAFLKFRIMFNVYSQEFDFICPSGRVALNSTCSDGNDLPELHVEFKF